MNTTEPTTATDHLSLSTAPSGRWAAWVAGIAATVGAAIAAVALLGVTPAPAPEPVAPIAIHDRTDELQSRADDLRARMDSMRERLKNRPEAQPEPETPTPTTKPPKKKPPVIRDGGDEVDDVDDGPGPIVIDPKCSANPMGCLRQ